MNCILCGEDKQELNEFGVCKDCWVFVLRAQNIVYGGKGVNPYEIQKAKTETNFKDDNV